MVTPASVYVADSREQALKEAGPYTLYFFHTLFSHGNLYNVSGQRQSGYVTCARKASAGSGRRSGKTSAARSRASAR